MWALAPPHVQTRIRGFVLNKFRGDAALLDPGPERLAQMTGVPLLRVIPMVDHGLPDEDGADPRPTANGALRVRVRVVRGPAASNLDEWWPFREVTSFAWATEPGHLLDADLIVLPGSKQVAADLDWSRKEGLDRALAEAHGRGVPMLAVCGGIQLLGGAVEDPHGVERPAQGLRLVSAHTVFASTKRVVRTEARFDPTLAGPWAALAGLAVKGYEVRYGHSGFGPDARPVLPGGLGFVEGNVLGIYLHGLVENPAVLAALTGRTPARNLEQVFAGLADLVDEHLDLNPLL